MRAKSETTTRRNRSFEEARRGALARLPKGLDLRWTPAREGRTPRARQRISDYEGTSGVRVVKAVAVDGGRSRISVEPGVSSSRVFAALAVQR